MSRLQAKPPVLTSPAVIVSVTVSVKMKKSSLPRMRKCHKSHYSTFHSFSRLAYNEASYDSIIAAHSTWYRINSSIWFHRRANMRDPLAKFLRCIPHESVSSVFPGNRNRVSSLTFRYCHALSSFGYRKWRHKVGG